MSLKVWLPLDGSLENKGVSNLTFTSTTVGSWSSDGKIGKALSMLGTSLEMKCPALTGVKEFSLAFWYKANSNSSITTNWLNIIALIDQNEEATQNGEFRFESSYANASYIISQHDNGYYNIADSAWATGAAWDTWYHLCITCDGTSKVRMYKNGVATSSTQNYMGGHLTGVIKIANESTKPDGLLNDVRIYDHCLSPLEVKELSQGLVAHYKLNGLSGGAGENLVVNYVYNGTVSYYSTTLSAQVYENDSTVPSNHCVKMTIGTASGTGGPYFVGTTTLGNTGTQISRLVTNEWYTVSYWIKSDKVHSSAINTTAEFLKNVTFIKQPIINNYWQQVVFKGQYNGNTTSAIAITIYEGSKWTAGENCWVSSLKVEHGTTLTSWTPALTSTFTDTTKVIDSSGYQHHGTLVDGTYESSIVPRYGNHVNLYGATVDSSSNTITGAQYFYASLPLPASSALTVAWWANIQTYGRGGIFETTATTGKIYEGTDYNTTAIANWDSTFRLYNGTNSYNFFSYVTKDSNWHHRAITFGDGYVRYYEDGVEKTSSALTGSVPAITGLKVGLGKAGGVYRQIKQQVCDFRYYITTLSAADILDLYKTSASIDNLNKLHGFELVEDLTDSVYKNGIASTGKDKTYLVNNFTETGTTTGWTFGGSPTISNGVVTLTGNNPTIQSANFTVGADDIVCFSGTIALPTPSTSTSGPGLYLGTPTSTSTDIYYYNFSTRKWVLSVSASTNPYFIQSYNLTDKYTFKTYVVGSNVDLANLPLDAESNNQARTLYALKLNATTTSKIRSGYNTNTSMVITLYNFEVYKVDQNGLNEIDNTASIGKGYMQFNNFIEK